MLSSQMLPQSVTSGSAILYEQAEEQECENMNVQVVLFVMAKCCF